MLPSESFLSALFFVSTVAASDALFSLFDLFLHEFSSVVLLHSLRGGLG